MVNIRIGIIQSPPFTIVTNVIGSSGQTQAQYTGYVPDLINLLQTAMGFNPVLILAPSTQTYDQIIQGVPAGTYDVVIGDVTVTAQRREIVDFSSTIFDNSLRLLMRSSDDVGVDLSSFLKPFSRNLWLLILGTCIYAGILFCIIERQHNEALEERSIATQGVMSTWYAFGNIVGYGVDFDANTAAGRLLTFGLYILSLILVASYTANLASDLTIQKSQGVITGIDDIKSGKIPYNRIGIRVGTASEDYYLTEISNGVKNYYPLSSKQDTYDSLLANRIDVSFIDSGVGEYVTENIYCNLTLVGDGFDVGVFGIVTPKNWLYGQDLDVNVLQLRESGAIDGLYQKWFQKSVCPDISTTSTALGIESLGGLFVTFAVISILSLLLMAWTGRRSIKTFCLVTVCRKKTL
jgi:polar amino acid transport system substrate-binding protein